MRVPRPEEYRGERSSLAYFANVGLHTPLQARHCAQRVVGSSRQWAWRPAHASCDAPLAAAQGPSRRYPAVTFTDMLAKRAEQVPLTQDPLTGKVAVAGLVGKAGGPDFAEEEEGTSGGGGGCGGIPPP